MGFNDHKIENTDITTYGVVAAPDVLSGTAEDNKKLFDRLIREIVRVDFNGLIQDLQMQSAAEQIGFQNVEGLNASNIQDAIEIIHEREQELEPEYQQVLEQITALVQAAAGSATSAESSATSSASSASASAGSASNAASSATSASSSASSAASSASSAEASAERAEALIQPASQAATGDYLRKGANGKWAGSKSIPYTTTVPTSQNTDGIKIAVLTSKPSTLHDGWLYIIKK